DATADPARMGRTPLTVDIEVEGAGVAPLLRPKKEERGPPFDQIILAEERRDLEEHMRLLYVALTRTADRLIVSGAMPKARKDGADPRPANCWHLIVEQAMTPIATPGVDHMALRYGGEGAALKRTRDKVEVPAAIVPERAWLTRPFAWKSRIRFAACFPTRVLRPYSDPDRSAKPRSQRHCRTGG